MSVSGPTLDFTEISRQISAGSGGAPVDKWNPDFCGDINLLIKRDGSWWYNGTPMGRPAMVKLFSSVLWKEDGRYFLKTPVEKMGIQVEDVPFLFVHVERVETESGSGLLFITQTEDQVIAGPNHPLRVVQNASTGEPSPYLLVRFGMEGLLSRSVFYSLVDMAHEVEHAGETHLAVTSLGQEFLLGAT